LRALALGLVAALVGVTLAHAAKPNKRESDEEIGKKLYLRHCVACHGESAAGDGAAAASLVVPVPDVRGKLQSKDREKWSKLVLAGKGTMPAFDLSLELDDARRVMREMERRSVAEAKARAPSPPSPTTPPAGGGSTGAPR
jgi:mono/diheme cytochrome c family protein